MPPVSSWVRARSTSSDRRTMWSYSPSSSKWDAQSATSSIVRGEALVDVDRRRGFAMRRVPGEPDVDDLALVHLELAAVREAVGRELGTADDDRIRTGDREQGVPVRSRTVVLGNLPHPGDRVRVVEADAQHLFHGDGAADAGDPSHDVGASIPNRHEVGHLDLAGLARPAGDEHEGVVEVAPRGGRASRRPGARSNDRAPRYRAGRRRSTPSRSAGGRASRCCRRGRRAPPCGRRRSARSPRSGAPSTVPPRQLP